jgi:hypothetical protein
MEYETAEKDVLQVSPFHSYQGLADIIAS